MVDDFMEGAGESQASLNVRALSRFSAVGADGNPVAYGSKVALESDPNVPFSVIGWAVTKARPMAVLELFGESRESLADALMIVPPSALVRLEQYERIADDPLIRELEAQNAEYAEGVEGEPPAPFAARGKDESAREEAAEAQAIAESLGLSIGCKVGLKDEEGTYVLLALVTDEDGPCAVLGETHGGVSTVPLASFAESGLEVRG